MTRPNGAVLWSGASLLDGAPIVVIATGLASGSTNSKTGPMVQTYILRQDVAPTEAVRTGVDGSICGDCPHRGRTVTLGDAVRNVGRTCYVNVGQGPQAVWRTWERGGYPDQRGQLELVGAARVVRLGTYGDPAAVPAWVWGALVSKAVAHTGYTHQWRKSQALRSLCMASADSPEDAAEAQAAGWRTFRVALPCHPEKLPGEVTCPASAEAGRKLVCADCRACGGADGRKGSIVIQAHGGFAVMANVRKLA